MADADPPSALRPQRSRLTIDALQRSTPTPSICRDLPRGHPPTGV